MIDTARRAVPGRPEATTHAAIELAAFRLFAERGFERTTLEDIASDAALKHTEWRAVIAAYEQWLHQPGSGLATLLASSMGALVEHLDG